MIPKVIHYFWFGGKELPKEYKKNIMTWRKYCPEYKIVRWSEKNYDVTKNQYMNEAFISGKYGFVPDFARLDVIYRYGGIYLDVDVALVRNLDDLLCYEGYVGFENYNKRLHIAMGQGFGAIAGNNVIKDLLAIYDTRQFIKPNGTYDLRTSSELVSNYFVRNGVYLENRMQELEGMKILPCDYFCPWIFIGSGGKYRIKKITRNTHSIHYFAGTWK